LNIQKLIKIKTYLIGSFFVTSHLK